MYALESVFILALADFAYEVDGQSFEQGAVVLVF
jgi:hypothetical protein